jgi:uncharacterized protein YbcI
MSTKLHRIGGDMIGPDGTVEQARAPATRSPHKRGHGEINAAIAEEVGRIYQRRAGRGPTRAKAFRRGNLVVVLLEEVMTAAERTLLGAGRDGTVKELRAELHGTMRSELIAAVEALTGSSVTGLMNDSELDRDLAVEVFVIDRPRPVELVGEVSRTPDGDGGPMAG